MATPALTLAAIVALAAPASGIVRRHDRDDSRYLELAESWDAVVRVGPGMGDGTLIAPEFVLTAAHVAIGLAERGGHVEAAGKRYEVADLFIHPEYLPLGGHDIAVVRLQGPVPGIDPLPLYETDDEEGRVAILVGHGATGVGSDRARHEDGKRRAATNRVESASAGELVFRFDAPPEGTDLEGIPGPGDSGGPALIEAGGVTYVAGVSWAGHSGPGGPGSYGSEDHFVRVSTHASWIRDVLAGAVPPRSRPESVSVAGADDLDTVAAQGPAAQRLVELWRALQADDAALEALIAEAMAPSLLERRSPQDLLAMLRRLRADFAGFQLRETISPGSDGIDGIFQGNGERRILGVRVEPQAPHRITGILTGRP